METKGKLIYLAAPYTYHKRTHNPLLAFYYWIRGINIRWFRFESVNKAASIIFKSGNFVFSPISHTRPIAKYGLPSDFKFYETYDKMMISKCDELWVLTIEGWSESIGVTAEIAEAQRRKIPVRYVKAHDTFIEEIS